MSTTLNTDRHFALSEVSAVHDTKKNQSPTSYSKELIELNLKEKIECHYINESSTFIILNNHDAALIYSLGFYGKGTSSRCKPQGLCNNTENLLLLGVEVAYLHHHGIITVINEEPLLEHEVLKLLVNLNVKFLMLYTVYHHFRDLGYVVRSGLKFGGDFVLYNGDPDMYHAAYQVRCVMGEPTEAPSPSLTWNIFSTARRVSESVAKEHVAAFVKFTNGGPETSKVSPKPGDEKKFEDIIRWRQVSAVILKRWVPERDREAKTRKKSAKEASRSGEQANLKGPSAKNTMDFDKEKSKDSRAPRSETMDAMPDSEMLPPDKLIQRNSTKGVSSASTAHGNQNYIEPSSSTKTSNQGSSIPNTNIHDETPSTKIRNSAIQQYDSVNNREKVSFARTRTSSSLTSPSGDESSKAVLSDSTDSTELIITRGGSNIMLGRISSDDALSEVVGTPPGGGGSEEDRPLVSPSFENRKRLSSIRDYTIPSSESLLVGVGSVETTTVETPDVGGEVSPLHLYERHRDNSLDVGTHADEMEYVKPCRVIYDGVPEPVIQVEANTLLGKRKSPSPEQPNGQLKRGRLQPRATARPPLRSSSGEGSISPQEIEMEIEKVYGSSRSHCLVQ